LTVGERLNSLPLDALYAEISRDGLVRRLFELARDEDGANSDMTTRLTRRETHPTMSARVRPRAPAVIAGVALMPELAGVWGGEPSIAGMARDGDEVAAGSVVATLTGPPGAVLGIERTLLNLMGRLSGIATLTHRYVAEARKGGPAKVCDTRKTTPGMRMLEKYAVRCGGGWLHRINLSDAVLIKDNHIAGLNHAALPEFVRRASDEARPRLGPAGFVEIEVDALDQLRAVLEHAADAIDIALLDNMALEDMREAVRFRDDVAPRVELEASGGIALETIGPVAETGVDRIAVGALTHQATSIDIGLDILGSDEP